MQETACNTAAKRIIGIMVHTLHLLLIAFAGYGLYAAPVFVYFLGILWLYRRLGLIPADEDLFPLFKALREK